MCRARACCSADANGHDRGRVSIPAASVLTGRVSKTSFPSSYLAPELWLLWGMTTSPFSVSSSLKSCSEYPFTSGQSPLANMM